MEEKSANFMFRLSYPYYTPPNYSRPIPTDTMDRHDIPALDLPQKKIGAFWAASPAVRPWTRREAVLPLPMRRRRDGCRRRRTMGATTHPGMMLPPRVIVLLCTSMPCQPTAAPLLPPCRTTSLVRVLTGTRSIGHDVGVVYPRFGASQPSYPTP